MTASENRCTYCRRVRPASCFSGVGDHVIPASLGGVWIDRNTCDECNTTANRNADELIAKDPVVRFLRNSYAIRDRYGRLPPPSRIAVRVPDGGVVHVSLGGKGPTYTPAMPPEVVSRLGLADASQKRMQAFVASVLGFHPSSPVDSLILARAAQRIARTPEPTAAWSRFMAKIALACGREAYGDKWLDKPWAQILSEDLLGSGVPRFAQRDHTHPSSPRGHTSHPDTRSGSSPSRTRRCCTSFCSASCMAAFQSTLPTRRSTCRQPGPSTHSSARSIAQPSKRCTW